MNYKVRLDKTCKDVDLKSQVRKVGGVHRGFQEGWGSVSCISYVLRIQYPVYPGDGSCLLPRQGHIEATALTCVFCILCPVCPVFCILCILERVSISCRDKVA